MTSFPSWLDSDPVRDPIVARLAGGVREWPDFRTEVVRYVRMNPAVALCDRTSLREAIADCGTFGVPMGEAFIKAARRIGNAKPEAVAILGYHGKVRLLKHHQLIIDIDAKCVYENDKIEIVDGTNPTIDHRYGVNLLERGALVGGWCKCYTSRRFTHIVVMHRSEIDEIRQQYSEDFGDGDLEDFARWYVPKTLIHQMEKVIQIPKKIRETMPSDLVERGEVAAPADISFAPEVSRPSGFPVDPRAPRSQVAA